VLLLCWCHVLCRPISLVSIDNGTASPVRNW